MDILYISLAVYAADRLELRDNSEDSWTREFTIYMPVQNDEVWNDNKILLEEMLGFLTGDKWNFCFRKSMPCKKEEDYKLWLKKRKREIKNYSKVCMFSGGVDSFVGAVDLLESYNGNVVFVSHYGGGKGTKEYQDCLKKIFIQNYHVEDRDFCQFHAKVINGVEDTTRSRSFMFFAHAIVIASALGGRTEIIIPENGLISLNIPLSYSRIGSSSTRTTHPYYMSMLQKLIDCLGLDLYFNNPYQFKTKGEMLVECRNIEFMKNNISNTMSCAHPDVGRNNGESKTRHCGYCLPCVVRQAAMKKANIKDDSSYRDRNFNKLKISDMIKNSYILAFDRFYEKYAFMEIQMNGRIDKNISDFTELYIRGMKEVKEYIEEVVDV